MVAKLTVRGPVLPDLLREVFPHIAVEFEDVVVVKLIENLTPFLAVGDETGGAQGAELVGDGGLGGAELGGEVADAVFLIGQQGNETEARGIR